MRTSISRYVFMLSFVTVILAAVLISCGTTSPGSKSTTLSPRSEFEERLITYMSILRQEGFSPRIDEDGDIEFAYQDNTYYLTLTQSDPSFVYVSLYFGYVDTYDALQRHAIAIGNANRTYKVAKAYFVDDNLGRVHIYISADEYLEDPSSLRAIISRMRSSVYSVAESIMNEVN
jgi:hypothetical protein